MSSSVNRITILGLGLIGGSWALALRRAAAVTELVAWGRDQHRLDQAVAAGIVDSATTDMKAAVAAADVVVIATPLSTMATLFEQLAPLLAAHTVVTDVGSAKARVIELARERLGDKFSRFVPGHPVAGSEHSGFEAATAGLFERRRVVLTPAVETDAAACALIEELWRATGAEVVRMDAVRHDQVLALTSHLPHVVAYLLVDMLARQGGDEATRFAAGGFYDITRIASSSPQMWCDIFLENRACVDVLLGQYIDSLQHFRQAIVDGDTDYLMQVMQRAKATRDKLG